MASSSDRLSPHQQALMTMLDQAAAQLGLDRGAIQRAKQQVAMIPPDRVAAALQKVAVRAQPRPLRGPVSPSRPPEMGRGDERMMNEFAKIQDQRTLFSKDTRTPGTYRSRGAASTLPPAKADEPYRGEKPILVEPRRYEKKRELGENVMKTVRAEKEKERLLRLKWEVLRGKRPEPKKRTWIDEPPEERGMGELGAAKRELHEAKDRAHGLGSGPDDPIPAPVGKRLGPDERKMLTMKKDNDWTRAREEMENMEARTITVDKAFEELQETREGDKVDAAKGLREYGRRPVDQKDPVRGEWQTTLRAESDNRGVRGTPQEQRERFEKSVRKASAPVVMENERAQKALEESKHLHAWGSPEREAAFERAKLARKRLGLLATDVIEEATRMPGEEAFASKVIEGNPMLKKAYIERLEYLRSKNPKDANTRDQLNFAREGKYGAALSSGKMAYSEKTGNTAFQKQARHQRDMAADHKNRFTTRATAEGRDEVEKGEEKWSDSEAVEKSRKKDFKSSDREVQGAAEYNRELDKLNRKAEDRGSLMSRLGDEDRADRALGSKARAKLAARLPQVDQPPLLIRKGKEKAKTQVTRKMAEEWSQLSTKELAAALKEEPMLFKVVKTLLKRGH